MYYHRFDKQKYVTDMRKLLSWIKGGTKNYVKTANNKYWCIHLRARSVFLTLLMFIVRRNKRKIWEWKVYCSFFFIGEVPEEEWWEGGDGNTNCHSKQDAILKAQGFLFMSVKKLARQVFSLAFRHVPALWPFLLLNSNHYCGGANESICSIVAITSALCLNIINTSTLSEIRCS
jgi:hypothetical protein